MRFSLSHSHSGFTLIELMISMTIFGILSIMILQVYFQTTNTSRKLNASRQLTDTARQITEKLSEDIARSGINPDASKFPSHAYPLYNNHNYTSSGGQILAIGSSGSVLQYYIYGTRTDLGVDPCPGDIRIHCGLYIFSSGSYYNLVESFIPEEEKKRVKITDLRFYISGKNTPYTQDKVTLVIELSLMPRIGVPSFLSSDTRLRIQTTLSERIYTQF